MRRRAAGRSATGIGLGSGEVLPEVFDLGATR